MSQKLSFSISEILRVITFAGFRVSKLSFSTSSKILCVFVSWPLFFEKAKLNFWQIFIKLLLKTSPNQFFDKNLVYFLCFCLLTFDLCKGHTQFLTKSHQISSQCNLPISFDKNLLYFVRFCLLAFDLCKGHTHFLKRNHQITSQGNVPTTLNQNLMHFVAISSALYYPCSLCTLTFIPRSNGRRLLDVLS